MFVYVCVCVCRGRVRKQLKNLEEQDKIMENLLGSQEMEFVEVSDMPVVDVGGTSEECAIYRK